MRMRIAVAFCAALTLSLGVATATAGTGNGGNSTNAQLCYKGGWQHLYRSDGGTFANQDACVSYAAMGGKLLNSAPIVGMAVTPDGGGYWLVNAPAASTCSATPLLTARSPGSTCHPRSSAWRPPPTAGGYWLVASDGGIFAFGDARFYGSIGGTTSTHPIVGMAAHPRRRRLLAGRLRRGIFAFGDAAFHGSTRRNQAVIPDRGHGGHGRRRRLLAGRRRRRHLRLRRRPLLRLTRVNHPDTPDRRYGGRPRRRRLLARQRRRHHLSIRRRDLTCGGRRSANTSSARPQIGMLGCASVQE